VEVAVLKTLKSFAGGIALLAGSVALIAGAILFQAIPYFAVELWRDPSYFATKPTSKNLSFKEIADLEDLEFLKYRLRQIMKKAIEEADEACSQEAEKALRADPSNKAIAELVRAHPSKKIIEEISRAFHDRQ
jgi:hypothetical protein